MSEETPYHTDRPAKRRNVTRQTKEQSIQRYIKTGRSMIRITHIPEKKRRNKRSAARHISTSVWKIKPALSCFPIFPSYLSQAIARTYQMTRQIPDPIKHRDIHTC